MRIHTTNSSWTAPVWLNAVGVIIVVVVVTVVLCFLARLVTRAEVIVTDKAIAVAASSRAKVLKLLGAPIDTTVLRIPSNEPNAKDLDAIIMNASATYKVPEAVIRVLITVESNWKQSSIRYEPALLKGADTTENRMLASSHGLMQVIHGIWRGHGPCPADWTELYLPHTNIMCGTYVIAEALKSADSITSAFRIYNCGRAVCPRADPYADRAVDLLVRDYLRGLNQVALNMR